MSEERSYTLLVNPSSGSGRGKRRLPEAERALRRAGADFRIVPTTSLGHGVEEALKATEAGTTPVVMSGDGLIGAVGGALAGSETALGVIPGGRGNDFARAVGIPTEPGEAVANLLAGNERTVDVGEVNGERFLCIASTGFDSECNRLANQTRLVRGNLVYAYSALRTLASWKPAHFTVMIDGEAHEFSGYSVAVANTPYFGGGMKIAPGADPGDGLFEVVAISDVGKLSYVSNLPKVFKGAHTDNDEVTVLHGAEVEISADRPFEIYADGEHLTDLPAKLRLLRSALRVIVPASA